MGTNIRFYLNFKWCGEISITLEDVEYTSLYRGKRHYELSNHLGNVQVVISDKRVSICDEYLGVERFEAEVLSAVDYYPGGMLLPERQWYAGNDSALAINGFNGMRNDHEINGHGNAVDFGARIYDSRLVRWLSVDPHQIKYPDLSSYCFVANNPILFVDIDGKDLVVNGDAAEFKKMKTVIEVKFSNAVIVERNEKTNQVTMSFNEEVVNEMAKTQNTTAEKIKEQLSADKGYQTLQTIMDPEGKTTTVDLADTKEEKDKTLIGKWGWDQILDMDDILLLDDQPASGGAFAGGIIHELWEAYDYQVTHNRYLNKDGDIPLPPDGKTPTEAYYLPSHQEAEKKEAEVMGVIKEEHDKGPGYVSIIITRKIGKKTETTTYTFNTDSHEPKNLESPE